MFFVTALIVTLVVGDFGSTFFYHVPQHLWFTLHLRTHHDRRRPYFDHAVLSTNPAVLLDGFLGAIPYMVVAALFGASPGPARLPASRSGQLTSGGATRATWAGGLPTGARRSCAPWESCFPRTMTGTTEIPRSSLATSSASTMRRLARSCLARANGPSSAECRPARDEEGSGQSLIEGVLWPNGRYF